MEQLAQLISILGIEIFLSLDTGDEKHEKESTEDAENWDDHRLGIFPKLLVILVVAKLRKCKTQGFLSL